MNQSLGVVLCMEQRETEKPDQLAGVELCLHVIGPSPRQVIISVSVSGLESTFLLF
jgi:hypothetical protein